MKNMGSLPNLRDIEKVEEVFRKPFRRFAERFPHQKNQSSSRGHNDAYLCPHRTIRQTRSIGNYASTSLNTQQDKICHFFTAEEGVGYSPVSTRSTRSNCTIHHHVHSNVLVRRNSRHRDSMSSSGGASSVRRLIAVVRSTPSKSGPVYSRKLLFRNFAALCLGHAMVTAALVPLFILQGSISVWGWQTPFLSSFLHPDNNAGSLLLTLMFSIATLSTLGTIFFVNKLGTNWSLILSYGGSCLFVGAHLFPRVYTLIPAYLFMGAWFGPLVAARLSCLMTLASKLTFVMTEEEEDEADCAPGFRKSEIILHRLFRGLQIAQDFGLIIGNIVTSFLLWYTTTVLNDENNTGLDIMFSLENNGDRICGSASCPRLEDNTGLGVRDVGTNSNVTNAFQTAGIPCKTSTMLVSVFLGFCVMGVAVTAAFIDHLRLFHSESKNRTVCSSSFRLIQEAFRDPRLQLAAPLSVFIGLEQGFIFADFTKFYVTCAVGVSSIPLVFISLGILQSVATFTLSLLLQHIRRHVIIAVGFLFQSCLLLVLLLWKPSREDPALFYVVPGAWGVCNAIWDTLSFSLLVSLYPDATQAPFAHSYFFRYLGLALSFGVHGSLCNWMKLYGLAGGMVIAITAYTCLEVRHHGQRKLKVQLSAL